MHPKRLILFLVVSAVGVACAAPIPRLESPALNEGDRSLNYTHDVKLFEVSNGMLVALVPEKNTNLVKVDVRYRVGAAEDPDNKDGLAHLVEHMLFTVRTSDGGPTIDDMLAKASLGYNAYTNWDETHYTATALTDQLDTLLQAEQLRMKATCDGIDETVLARERQVVVQELLQRNLANGDLAAPVRAFLFGKDHAYTRSPGGTTKTVMNLSRDDVCKFIDNHYAPERAILVVSGNIDPTKLRPTIGRMFGPIAKHSGQERRGVRKMTPKGKTTIALDVEESAVIIAFPAPKWGTKWATRYDLLTTALLVSLKKAAKDKPYIKHVTATRLGGYRGGATAFIISTDSPENLPKALALYKAARGPGVSGTEGDELRKYINYSHLGVIRAVEPFAQRASLVADYLQYADDKWLMIGDLQRLSALPDGAMAEMYQQRYKLEDAHIIRIVPDKRTGGAKNKRVNLSTDTKEYDLESWREPVDPKQADRALSIPRNGSTTHVAEETLGNGLRVMVVSGLTHPVVDARIVFPTGTAHDPADKKGLSQATAYLMEPDYKRLFNRADVSDVNFMAKLGITYEPEVGEQATSFHVRALSNNTDAALWHLYRWVQTGTFAKDDLRQAQKRAAAAKPDDDDARVARAYRALATGLYGAGHPYVPRETAPSLSRISLGDLQRYRRNHYRLRGATLIITGKLDHMEVMRRIHRLFGSMKDTGAPPPLPEIPEANPAAGPKYMAFVDEDAAQPRVLIAFPTATGVTKHAAARAVLEEILRQRMSQIRERFAATYGIEVQTSERRGPGTLLIRGNLDPNHGGKALAAMNTALDELRQGTGLAADFVRARRKVFQQMLASSVDSSSVAAELEFVSTHGLPNDYFYKLAGEIARLTPAHITKLVSSELAADRAIVLVAGPAATIKKVYGAANILRYTTAK